MLGDAGFPAIISTVQSDGIKEVVAIVGRAIAQWFAIHEIARRGLETLGRQCLECLWIGAVSAMISLERKRGNEDPASCFRIGSAGKESLSAPGSAKASLPESSARLKPLSRGTERGEIRNHRKCANFLPCRTRDRAAQLEFAVTIKEQHGALIIKTSPTPIMNLALTLPKRGEKPFRVA